jgi:hypothetical protein
MKSPRRFSLLKSATMLVATLPTGFGIIGSQYRWPGGLMPYEVDPALPNKNRVTDAIAHWTQNTSMRFVARTGANAGSYPNYVRFRPATGC